KIDAEQYPGGHRKDAVFDARPSDGIAIALRIDCPIVVSDDVIDEAGQPPEAFEADADDPDDHDVGDFEF
ncbi:MAG: bifunctional nuclease domain-containing protein, partial [Halapricum sp.]